MANVSSSNGIEKRPKLQFHDANGHWFPAWKRYRFDTLYKPVSEKNDLSYGVESIISVANMYFKPDARISDPEYLRTYNIFKYGDIAFEGNKSKSYANGRFVENTIGDGIVSHVFNVLRPISSKHNLEYWKYAINNENVMGRILARCTKKTTMMTNLVTADFLEQEICCPIEPEQQKIALFLSLMEKRIATQGQLVEHLKKYKRGVSKKLFDEIHKDSSCVIKQFSEVFEPLQNNTFSRECLTNDPSDVLNIHYGDILVKYGSVVDIDIDEVPYIKPETDISKYNSSSYLQNGDVVFADTAEDYTVGKTCEITNASGHRVLSGLHTMPYRPTINFVPMYLGYYFNSAAFRAQILPMIQGAKVSSISKSEMKKTTLHIPAIESQMKVVNILYTLDERIKRTELGLQELQQIKKGLLQNLFI